MHSLVKRYMVWTWIALLGVLFSALAPTISHAMAAAMSSAAARADDEMQVCTMDGMKTVVVDGAAGKFDPHKFEHFLEHCPYCVLHGGQAFLPPYAAPAFAVPDASSSYPPLFYRSATPLFSWRAANPRGPPVSS
jgi:hypothetical protein